MMGLCEFGITGSAVGHKPIALQFQHQSDSVRGVLLII